LRAIRAGRCRERRYADHIFIQIYFRMHHFVVKFSTKNFASGGKGSPNQNHADALGPSARNRVDSALDDHLQPAFRFVSFKLKHEKYHMNIHFFRFSHSEKKVESCVRIPFSIFHVERKTVLTVRDWARRQTTTATTMEQCGRTGRGGGGWRQNTGSLRQRAYKSLACLNIDPRRLARRGRRQTVGRLY